MPEGQDRGLLSIGAFLIILVISIMLYSPLELIHWSLIPPLILALYGCWTILLAGIRASNPQKYERAPFSTFAGGLILLTVGGAWFLWSVNWIYSLALILLVSGVLAIVTTMKKG